jgi:predicted dehydrogenase
MHRVLVVGVGSIGERHLRCFRETGRADVSFVELNESLRETIADCYRVPAHADLEAALKSLPDVAVIATPAPLHVPLATQLVQACVHVLIEKPLGTTLNGVDLLCHLVRERRVTAAVGYVQRCHPLLLAMRREILGGRFGKPLELVSVSGQHFPTFRPAYRSIYYTDRATGGGAIQDALTHALNAGEWLLGPINRVVADAAHQSLEGVRVEDTVHLLARHGDVLASYSLNQYQAPNEWTLAVVCEKGTARWEPHEHRWRCMTHPGGTWQEQCIEPLERDTLFVAQANAFLDAVEGAGDPPCNLDDGVQTLRVNLAALASVESGSWQAVERSNPS